jgi:hypothetical protein
MEARPVSLPRWYGRIMIDLGSVAGLHEHDHELHAFCGRCDRWGLLPLERLIAQGKGSLRPPIRVRCRDCGEAGQIQVRPPIPEWTNSNGWMAMR